MLTRKRFLTTAALLVCCSGVFAQSVALDVTNEASNELFLSLKLGNSTVFSSSAVGGVSGAIVANTSIDNLEISSIEIESGTIFLDDTTFVGTILGGFQALFHLDDVSITLESPELSVENNSFLASSIAYAFTTGSISYTIPFLGISDILFDFTTSPVQFVSTTGQLPGSAQVSESGLEVGVPVSATYFESSPVFTSFELTLGGFIGTSGAVPPVITPGSVDATVADSTDAAYVIGNQQLPQEIIVFRSLDVLPDSSFTLDPDQTLQLTDGPLIIAEGATFIGNGIVDGDVINQGLLIIPIVRLETVSQIASPPPQVSPGVTIVDLPPPPQPGEPREPIIVPVSDDDGSFTVSENTGVFFAPVSGGGAGGGGGGVGPIIINCTDCGNSGTISTRYDADLTITGAYTQTETAALRLFIAGEEQGISYSFLQVGQAATLAGKLEIVLQPELFSFLPDFGDSFDVILASGGITIDDLGLELVSLITAQGVSFLLDRGFELTSYNSGFSRDPYQLFEIEGGFFRFDLVENGTILRVTAVPEVSPVLLIGSACLLATLLLFSRRLRCPGKFANSL